MEASEQRYHAASKTAASLPQNMLTTAQRLKLYALFKQADQPAPKAAPSRFNAVARAKWEAWNDVRDLSKQQAMDAYSNIIEGLVKLTQQAQSPASPPKKHDVPTRYDSPPARAAPTQRAPTFTNKSTSSAVNLSADLTAHAEPRVDAQKWSATSLTVPAGSLLKVPIVVAEPSQCSYNFSTVDGNSIIFALSARDGEPLVTTRAANDDGSVETPLKAGEVLTATIDNTSAVFSSITIAVEVKIEPTRQLEELKKYRARELLRAELAAAHAAIADEVKREEHLQATLNENIHEIDRLAGLLESAKAHLTHTKDCLSSSQKAKRMLEESVVSLGQRLERLP